ETRDVEVRLSPESRRRASDLAALPLVVARPNGVPSTLPLGQVATIRESTGPAIIDHLDRELVVTVEANTSGRASGDVAADIEAGAIRLRPILMTTFALIAGMIPVALGRGEGAQFRAPLGIAVIGGVITSTFLTLLVIPTGYEILDEWRRAFSRFLGYRPRQM